MQLIFITHSAFAIKTDSLSIIIDFYDDKGSYNDYKSFLDTNVLNTENELYILSSHSHQDHFDKRILDFTNQKHEHRLILAREIYRSNKELLENVDAYYLIKNKEYEDDLIYIKAYGSTDIGISFYIYLKDIKKSIFHAGDLNNWHWNEESEESEILEYESFWYKELKFITNNIKELDLLLFPVDPRLGHDYAKGALEFLDKIAVHYFCPMHFWGDFTSANNIANLYQGKITKFIKLTHKKQIIDIF